MRCAALKRSLIGTAAAVLLVTGLGIAPVHADEKQDKVDEKERVDAELSDLRIELSGTNAELADAYVALRETELKIPQAEEELRLARAEAVEAQRVDRETGQRLQRAQREEEELSGQLESDAAQVDVTTDEMGELALDAYKDGGVPGSVSVFVGAESPQDAVDRSMLYDIALSSRNETLGTARTAQSVNVNREDRLVAVRGEIEELKAEAEETLRRKKAAETAAEERKNELDGLLASQTSQTTELERLKQKYQGEQATLSSRSQQLDSDIQALIQDEKRRAAEEQRRREERERQQQEQQRQEREAAGSRSSAPTDSGNDVYTGSSGAFAHPSPGRLSSNYGYRVHPIYGTRKLHAGDDYAAACGTPVRATADGNVFWTGSNSAAGNKLMISHGVKDGKLVTSSYHHLQSFAVRSGPVKQGDVVAYVGTTGSSTGCHLHFEIQEDGQSVDPGAYV